MSLVENYGPMLPEAELEEGPEFEMELEDIMVEVGTFQVCRPTTWRSWRQCRKKLQ